MNASAPLAVFWRAPLGTGESGGPSGASSAVVVGALARGTLAAASCLLEQPPSTTAPATSPPTKRSLVCRRTVVLPWSITGLGRLRRTRSARRSTCGNRWPFHALGGQLVRRAPEPAQGQRSGSCT